MFDTHTHLQFKAFNSKTDEVITSAKNAGVKKMIVVGTNLETSKNAISLAQKHQGLYASIGLHPHHVFSYCHPAPPDERSEGGRLQNAKHFDKGDSGSRNSSLRGVRSAGWRMADDAAISYKPSLKEAISLENIISNLESLISNPKVTAIGETGLDRHLYEKTHYKNYQITKDFIDLQKKFFIAQIKLAIKYQKSLIIHNREATDELLEIIESNWDKSLENHSVFHCCEPNQKILDFALKNNVYIGIDGDVTYDKPKQDFLKKVPWENLVLETDSPYFLPKPLRKTSHSEQSEESIIKEPTINEPKNLKIIAEFIANLKNLTTESVINMSSQNSSVLFKL